MPILGLCRAGSRLYMFGVVFLAPQDLSQLSHPRIVVGLSPIRTELHFRVISGWAVIQE